MSKPYHEILREGIHAERATSNMIGLALRVTGPTRRAAVIEALESAKANFVRHVNALEPHMAQSVLSGYGSRLGAMPLETGLCDNLVRMAQHRDASWDFVRGGGISAQRSPARHGQIYRLAWTDVLPARFGTLANAIDSSEAAADLWIAACLGRANLDAGHMRLCEIVAEALDAHDHHDTTRQGLARQFAALRDALNAEVSVCDTEQAQGDETERVAERQRG
jgi:hypothetical protein